MKIFFSSAVLIGILVLTGVGCARHQRVWEVVTTDQPPKEWEILKRQAAQKRTISEEYIDQHFSYVRLEELKTTEELDYKVTRVHFVFKIKDSEGKEHPVQHVETFINSALESRSMLRGFPSKELRTIIPQHQALALAKQSAECNAKFPNWANSIDTVELIWTPKREGGGKDVRPEGYAWSFSSVKAEKYASGKCLVDADDGDVSYEQTMELF